MVSSSSLTAMAAWSEEKASSFPPFQFPASFVEVIGWLKSIWATAGLLSTSFRRSLPLKFALLFNRTQFHIASLPLQLSMRSYNFYWKIYVVLMPLRSWLPRNKMLATYPFAVKHVFWFRVSATDRFYLFFFPLCSQFLLKFSLLDTTEGR